MKLRRLVITAAFLAAGLASGAVHAETIVHAGRVIDVKHGKVLTD
jgi:hypothetical protein